MESKEAVHVANVDETAAIRTAQVLMQLSNMFRNITEEVSIEDYVPHPVATSILLEETPRNEEVALRKR